MMFATGVSRKNWEAISELNWMRFCVEFFGKNNISGVVYVIIVKKEG